MEGTNKVINLYANTRCMNGKTVGKKGGRKSRWAFLKPVQPDDKLSEITGKGPLPRSELARRLWAYIRKHDLQDAKRKVIIHTDEKLRAVFNGKCQVTVVE